MFGSRSIPDDHKPFAALPVKMVTVGDGGDRMAVHVAGRLDEVRPPLICIPGYHRNMADYAEMISYFHLLMSDDWPVVLLDLRGRGRSTDRRDKSQYATQFDARDVSEVARSLAIETAILVGQGYGGQVVMALGALRPSLIAGTILLDAGPVSDSRGLVRLRNNLKDLQGHRSEAGLRAMFRRMLAPDYPGLQEAALAGLAARTHFVDKRGRTQGLFDPHLLKMLEPFSHDDVLVAQWQLYGALAHAPLLLMRTQLTQQLRRETFDEMVRRRKDADAYAIEGQGSPPLLNTTDDIQPMVSFLRTLIKNRKALAA